jgi:predicted nuclease of predicted toxin-antitoxin system
MKLLLDENISYRVVQSIESYFPESIQVTKVDPKLYQDDRIYDFAAKNGFAIVTFDEDFNDLQLLRGHPPKIIWLRFGNSSNLKVISKLLDNREVISSFLSNPDSGILEIY